MFELSEEHRMLQDLVAKFIDRDIMPLEKAVLARDCQEHFELRKVHRELLKNSRILLEELIIRVSLMDSEEI